MNVNSDEPIYSQVDMDNADDIAIAEILELQEKLMTANAELALLRQQLKLRRLH